MKELEERITKIITKTIKLNILFDIKKHVSPDVAKEVKDIAIEFAEWVDDMGYTQVENSFFKSFSDEKGKSTQLLFDQFIKQRYES